MALVQSVQLKRKWLWNYTLLKKGRNVQKSHPFIWKQNRFFFLFPNCLLRWLIVSLQLNLLQVFSNILFKYCIILKNFNVSNTICKFCYISLITTMLKVSVIYFNTSGSYKRKSKPLVKDPNTSKGQKRADVSKEQNELKYVLHVPFLV